MNHTPEALSSVADLNDPLLTPFTFLTECTAEKMCNTTGMYKHLGNWSNSYVNFEMEPGTEVEVKITKLWSGEGIMEGLEITKAVVRPESVATATIVNGEVLVRINKPALFTVDINGQMDDQVQLRAVACITFYVDVRCQ